jgi:hypothetical protein
VRFAYADPPYPGHLRRKLYASDPKCAEVDHAELVAKLVREFPDGWALSTGSNNLHAVLPLCPPDVRVMAWVKPFCSFKPGVNPAYAWEPVIVRGGRKLGRDIDTRRDWVSANILLKKGCAGAKPPQFCDWLFGVLGAQSGDDLADLYPGSGGVGRRWAETYGAVRWDLVSSADPRALAVVDGTGPFAAHGPHYSRRTPGARTFTGVGQEVVLVTACGRAVWACVRQRTPHRPGTGASRGRDGITDERARYLWRNMIFRNLGAGLSSDLICSATARTYEEWEKRYGALPEERLRTEIDVRAVRSPNKGYCYKVAGWVPDRVVRGKLYLWAPERKTLAASSRPAQLPLRTASGSIEIGVQP